MLPQDLTSRGNQTLGLSQPTAEFIWARGRGRGIGRCEVTGDYKDFSSTFIVGRLGNTSLTDSALAGIIE